MCGSATAAKFRVDHIRYDIHSRGCHVLDVSDGGAKLRQMEAFDLALDGEFRSGIAAKSVGEPGPIPRRASLIVGVSNDSAGGKGSGTKVKWPSRESTSRPGASFEKPSRCIEMTDWLLSLLVGQ